MFTKVAASDSKYILVFTVVVNIFLNLYEGKIEKLVLSDFSLRVALN